MQNAFACKSKKKIFSQVIFKLQYSRKRQYYIVQSANSRNAIKKIPFNLPMIRYKKKWTDYAYWGRIRFFIVIYFLTIPEWPILGARVQKALPRAGELRSR